MGLGALTNGNGTSTRAALWSAIAAWCAVAVMLGLGLDGNFRSDQAQIGQALKEMRTALDSKANYGDTVASIRDITASLTTLQTHDAINSGKISDLQAQKLATDQAIASISAQIGNTNITMQKISDQLEAIQSGKRR